MCGHDGIQWRKTENKANYLPQNVKMCLQLIKITFSFARWYIWRKDKSFRVDALFATLF